IVAEVETGKATMELESYEDGILLHIGVQEGDSVEIDGVIAVIVEKGADYQKLLSAHKSKSSGNTGNAQSTEDKPTTASAEKPASTEAKKEEPKAVGDSAGGNGRIKASPLAKKLAEEKGVDISLVKGTGDSGRIIKKDIESFDPASVKPAAQAAATSGTATVGQESFREEKVSQMRKVIAKRLAESKFSAPHFYLTMEIIMDKAIEARNSMNEIAPVKISFNDMVIKAAAA